MRTWIEYFTILAKRHIPHKTKSGSDWCVPYFWFWLFGGIWDNGNGYSLSYPLHRRIKRYYKEGWNKRYTLYEWLK